MTDIEGHILKDYDVKRRIGKGAYGIVWQAVDRRNGEIVAVKKIFDAFCNSTDAQRTYREIAFLQAFQAHENVITLLNVIRAENNNDIYLIFEYMDIDLHGATKANLLKSVHKLYIMYQLVKVMKYIHSGNVIHRDLKPSNILLNAECFVKLADFGLARSLTVHQEEAVDPDKALMTDYVATRWYRAPEILLGSPHYTHGVDMWSLGCILGEMLGGRPVFSGSSTINQVERIMCHLPQPSKVDMDSLQSPYTESLLKQVPRRPRRSLASLYPSASVEALDLMNRLLQFNPQKRISAELALKHAYMASFHDPSTEGVMDSDVIPKLSDNRKCDVDKYRRRLYQSIDLKDKEGPCQVSLDAPVHPIASCDRESDQPSLCSSSESSLHTLKSHHTKDTPLSPAQPSTQLHGMDGCDKPLSAGHCSVPQGHPPRGSKTVHRSSSNPARSYLLGNSVSQSCLPDTVSKGKHHSQVIFDAQQVAPPPHPAPPPQPTRGKFRPMSHTVLGPNSVLARTTEDPSKPGRDPGLCVTSARIVPQERPVPQASMNKKLSRGGPTQFATYTQTHATISQSKLNALRQCKW